jgi:hypothetical protein
MTTLNQTPPTVPIGRTASGELVYAQKTFYDLIYTDLFTRVGGPVALTNSEMDEYLQFDVREADAGELSREIGEIRSQLALLPDSTAAVAQLRQITNDLQEIADSLSSNSAALCAVLASRASDIETLQAFTR